MCICINCRHIEYCYTYHFIEKQHGYKQKVIQSTFIPIHNIVNVNIQKSQKVSLDWDLVECLSFIEAPGYWLS
uniref:Ycf34 n=1 Tax=Kuetzingia canaliculata TaxID=228262 RepID=A0A1Z1MP60_KUECA|nr:hypothetical protein [Kuetzingia canaliculata]ARW67838.1 hypothetical protein [Kuetzingia canaliculata]